MSGPRFWAAAFVLLLVAVGCALSGWRAIRAGEIERHRRRMLSAVGLIGLFLGAYLVKLAWLGRERLEDWERWELTVLYVHEVFVATMLVAGGRALWLSRSLFPRTSGSVPDGTSRSHRLWGRIAVGAAMAGLLTAAAVLTSIWRHATSVEGVAAPTSATESGTGS